MQTIIAITLLVCAVAWMGWNFGGKKLLKKSSSDEQGDCGPNCKCS